MNCESIILVVTHHFHTTAIAISKETLVLSPQRGPVFLDKEVLLNATRAKLSYS